MRTKKVIKKIICYTISIIFLAFAVFTSIFAALYAPGDIKSETPIVKVADTNTKL